MADPEDEATARHIAKGIMHYENVDNLEGFGQITIGRIEEMLTKAVLMGIHTQKVESDVPVAPYEVPPPEA